MDAIALLREQFKDAHEFLEATMEGITPEQVHWAPPGTANPISANYAHVVLSEDLGINGLLRGGAPLSAGGWAGRTGLSELPPVAPNAPWHEWALRVRIDLPALRAYARAVYAATDEALRALEPGDLEREVDLSPFGLGRRTVAWMLSGALLNVNLHCGEVSCLKGLQGLRGYPM